MPKLSKIILGVVFIAFFIVFTSVIYISYHSYRTQEIDNQRYQLDKTAAQISTLQTMVNNIANQIIYDEKVQNGITEKAASTGSYLFLKRDLQATLTRYSHVIDSIHEIMIYTHNGYMFTSRSIKSPFVPENNPWYTDFIASGRTKGYTQAYLSEPNQDGSTSPIISYLVSYYSIENTGTELGKLIISINFEYLEEITRLESSLMNGYCLYNSTGEELVKNGTISLTYDEIIAQNTDYIYHPNGDILFISSDMQNDWLLVSEISGKQLLKQSVYSYFGIIIWFLFIFFILLISLRYMIRRIVMPINQLSVAAEEVGHGNFDVRVHIQTNDELEMLAEVFNKMILDLQTYTRQSVEHEKKLRRMQIENLMLQINPHFIYNTMNSIVYMARLNGNPQIADFANAFISLLQNTLEIRSSIYNTVRNELSTVENYLFLQKYRYDDKFTYRIVCDDDLLDCQILNVMLQPAVENAIFHGISPKEGNGHLEITIQHEDDFLKITIEDDGIGMTKETLTELMNHEQKKQNGVTKIGIANVRDRIHEIFGEPHRLIIESTIGIGTKVCMLVPYTKSLE